MKKDILINLSKIIKDQNELLKTYNSTSGEEITMEEMLSELSPKRKSKKMDFSEILPGYCESVADMKRVRDGEMKIEDCIEKHKNVIKNWEA